MTCPGISVLIRCERCGIERWRDERDVCRIAYDDPCSDCEAADEAFDDEVPDDAA